MTFGTCSIFTPQRLYETLIGHLFPGDGDEHGAIIAAGVAKSGNRLRLLAREVFLARDDVDYVPGKFGYRMLRAEFIYEKIQFCRENKLCYIAIHNHGGADSVAFSSDDIASHERGYPALLDVMQGLPVGALVFAKNAAAADIWTPGGQRLPLNEFRVIGPVIKRFYSDNRQDGKASVIAYDRQLLMFGQAGQEILANSKIGIIGAGGVGSLLIEYLARLGVGHLVIADEDRIELSNLSRVAGATYWDARYPLTHRIMPAWLRRLGMKLSTKKVSIAKRVARQANPKIIIESIYGNFARREVAGRFCDCDFLFLAADSMQARLVFNAIIHQYLIPGIQIGAKVLVDEDSGFLEDAYSVYRWITPDSGCLWCNGLISRHGLAMEAKTDREREAQDYGSRAPSPSVITLNAVGAAHAANDFLMSFLGIANDDVAANFRRFKHRSREAVVDRPRKDEHCTECGRSLSSRFGMGNARELPTAG